ncbi:MAG TPA: hypothetical protein VGK64_00835 [Bryobacteraceae bacterium]
MLAEGHVVAAMTRTREDRQAARAQGAFPIFCDIFDPGAFRAAKPIGPRVVAQHLGTIYARQRRRTP